jgi:hypothetical protein
VPVVGVVGGADDVVEAAVVGGGEDGVGDVALLVRDLDGADVVAAAGLGW